jgi:hypothetical protein
MVFCKEIRNSKLKTLLWFDAWYRHLKLIRYRFRCGRQGMLTLLGTSAVSREPCRPGLYCGLFHLPNWTLILTADFSVYLTMRTDFDSGLFHVPNFGHWFWLLNFSIEWATRRMWPVSRGCLLLLGTWSHLWYFRGSVLAHLFIWLVIPTWISRLINLRCLDHFMHQTFISTNQSL